MNKKMIIAVSIAVGVLSLTIALYVSGLLERLEYSAYDQEVKLFRNNKKSSENIKVVLIDEASLKAMESNLGRWPWPREIWADFLDFMEMGEAKTVIFDILFTERQGGKHDKTLVSATKNAGNVHHSMMVLREPVTEDIRSELGNPMPKDFLDRFSLKNMKGEPALVAGKENNNFYLPFTDLYRVSKSINVVEFSPDKDGVYRRTKPIREYQGKYFPVHGFAPFVDDGSEIEMNAHSVKIGGKTLPLDRNGNVILNMYGKVETYSIGGIFASLQKIRQGMVEDLLVDPSEFKDSIVYVGASAVGVEDLKSTPIEARLPGVMLHVSLASNYIQDDFLMPPKRGLTYFSIVLGAVVTTFLVLFSKNFVLRVVYPAALLAVYLGFTLMSFKSNVIVEIIPCVVATFMSGFISLGYLTYTEAKAKKQVSQLFAQYVSKDVLDEIMTNYAEFVKSGLGTKREITILFSDIRSFTTFSENTEPERIVEMLNTHFSLMTEVILNNKGTVDKYIGDAIMAFWGAPIYLEDHAVKAVTAAMKMVTELNEVNRVLKEKGFNSGIKIGIGLNTGMATIGNIGSERKLNYTIIGDAVNLASRLEGVTKDYGCTLIISEYTYEKVKDKIPCRLLGNVKVKGREKLVDIYAPIMEGNEGGHEVQQQKA